MNAGKSIQTYLHTDHLNTPRRGTDSNGLTVWAWQGTAFGSFSANQDPDNDGTLTTVNLRFPGQVYDQETKLHYNYFRYYDPQIGRYLTSDPIGLRGGLNTFGYVGGNPLYWIDFFGLDRAINPMPGGPGGPNITFNNDVPGGSSTNFSVSDATAEMIEQTVREFNI